MKTKKILSAICIIAATAAMAVSFAGCGDDETSTSDPSYSVITADAEAHYLVFLVEGVEIERMLVLDDDTYNSLEVYFPTIPEKDGYSCYWEELDAVYISGQTEVYINAYYISK